MEDQVGLAVIAALYALVECIKYLTQKRSNGDSPSSVKQEEILELVRKTFDMHDVKDNNGLPLWYIPRDWADTQKDIATLVQKVSYSQESIANSLSELAKAFSKIAERSK